jgi:hypothetical protein
VEREGEEKERGREREREEEKRVMLTGNRELLYLDLALEAQVRERREGDERVEREGEEK